MYVACTRQNQPTAHLGSKVWEVGGDVVLISSCPFVVSPPVCQLPLHNFQGPFLISNNLHLRSETSFYLVKDPAGPMGPPSSHALRRGLALAADSPSRCLKKEPWLLVRTACAQLCTSFVRLLCTRALEQAFEQRCFFEVSACTSLVRFLLHAVFLLVRPCSEFSLMEYFLDGL